MNGIQLDPRTKVLLLFVANVLIFFDSSAVVTYAYMAVLAMVLFFSGCYKSIFVFSVYGAILLGIDYWIFPTAPKALSILFSISVNYTLKMFPCLMSGVLLIATTSFHEIVLAMRKCHLPQKLIITLSVTIRYFPAIFEEIRHIHNAMKLRNIPLSGKFECFIVPFMMAATNTAEELSAAAITRGIENPAKKTSMVQLCFGCIDYFVILVEAGFLFAAFVL